MPIMVTLLVVIALSSLIPFILRACIMTAFGIELPEIGFYQWCAWMFIIAVFEGTIDGIRRK